MDPLALPVAEVFGPVWQGEGPATGRRCSFVRLGLCNLSCQWCDTPFTWDRSRYDVDAECPPTAPEDVITALNGHGTDCLVLTGGEPLIHARHPGLAWLLNTWGGEVDVETNGTLPPPRWHARVRYFAVSPKINTRDPVRKRLRTGTLRQWSAVPGAFLKFVCTGSGDVDTAARLADDTGWTPDRVWIMPEGTTAAHILATGRALEEATARHGFHLTLRQQTLLHGDDRGH